MEEEDARVDAEIEELHKHGYPPPDEELENGESLS